MEYDAAFGPMGSLASSAQLPLNKDEVIRLQKALNSLGYGPLQVDGILGPKTGAAMRSFESTLGGVNEMTMRTERSVLGQAERLAAQKEEQREKGIQQTESIKMSAPASTPFYKNPWVLGTVAVAGVVAYIMYRTSESKAAVAGLDEAAPKRKKKSADRCGRTPTMDFADGEAVELEAPPHGQEVTDAED